MEKELNISRSDYTEATRYYETRYVTELYCEQLAKRRTIKDLDHSILERKVEEQVKSWAEMFSRRLKKELNADNKVEAEEQTLRAQELLESLENILSHTLDIDDTVDFNTLKNSSKFNKPKPPPPRKESLFILKAKEPRKEDCKPRQSFLSALFSSKEKFQERWDKAYQDAMTIYQQEVDLVNGKNEEIEKQNENAQKNYERLLGDWESEKSAFDKTKADTNAKVEQLKSDYRAGDPNAIEEYCEIVLTNSEYPDFVTKDFEIAYNSENQMLAINYTLPDIDDIPTLEKVTYVASTSTFKEKHISDAAKRKLYDNILYQITLRSIHEVFEADQIDCIKSITFNGWISTVDKSTGADVTMCLLTVQTNKEEFESIDLSRIDPKTCFKGLKGIASSKLHGLTPVQPLIVMDTFDKRFVDSKNVVGDIDQSTNLASISWEDFEHLIRELFEKEFSSNGGEVKVTQASRDGGVDAIAFDPDPIRGGKIAIQAKRYTNTVGVSAVRDLYGTVLNEGATKGILVTTSDYGPEAYNFAKDKPITLLNGANLLHLLERHGTKARIDIKEAKRLNAEL